MCGMGGQEDDGAFDEEEWRHIDQGWKKAFGEKSEEEACAGSCIQGGREEDNQLEVDRWVLAEQLGAQGTLVWLLSFSVAISDQRHLWLLDLRKFSGNLG